MCLVKYSVGDFNGASKAAAGLIKDGMSVFDIMRLVGRYRICR